MSITELKEIENALNTLMRYVLAGGAAVLAFGIIRPSHFRFLCSDGEHQAVSATLALLFVLVSGATVYLLHRALLFPFVFRCLLFGIIKRRKLAHTEKTLDAALAEKRLEYRKSNDHKGFHFGRWAAEVHALYGICLGSLIPFFVPLASDRQFSQYAVTVLIAAIFIFVAALRHHWRELIDEIEVAGIIQK